MTTTRAASRPSRSPISALLASTVTSLRELSGFKPRGCDANQESTGKPCLTSPMGCQSHHMDTAAAFAGFPTSALTFYAGLEADNSRDQWQEHWSTYENDVREPMLALLDGLEDEFGEARLFRPNRDVRFSAD